MTDIDRLEYIDGLFVRAAQLKQSDPEASKLLYAIAAEWFSSLLEAPTINLNECIPVK